LPGRAGTGPKVLVNALVDYRPQERDQRRKNDGGKVLRAGQTTPVRNYGRGGEVSGVIWPGLATVR
jgi:hypothetical protein